MISTVPDAVWLDSMTAARSVQSPPEGAQTPSPGFASTPSAVVFTVNVWSAAAATDAARNSGATRRASLIVSERRRPSGEQEVDEEEDVGDVGLRVAVHVAE